MINKYILPSSVTERIHDGIVRIKGMLAGYSQRIHKGMGISPSPGTEVEPSSTQKGILGLDYLSEETFNHGASSYRDLLKLYSNIWNMVEPINPEEIPSSNFTRIGSYEVVNPSFFNSVSHPSLEELGTTDCDRTEQKNPRGKVGYFTRNKKNFRDTPQRYFTALGKHFLANKYCLIVPTEKDILSILSTILLKEIKVGDTISEEDFKNIFESLNMKVTGIYSYISDRFSGFHGLNVQSKSIIIGGSIVAINNIFPTDPNEGQGQQLLDHMKKSVVQNVIAIKYDDQKGEYKVTNSMNLFGKGILGNHLSIPILMRQHTDGQSSIIGTPVDQAIA